jgi:serine/threonine protein kinase
MCGTVMYQDPDLQQKKSYCPFAADVWACGVTFFVILTGKWPFDGDFEADFKAKVQSGKYQPISSVLFETKKQESDINDLFKCMF